ncbi:Transcriptional regulator containing PAS, AAA-type ATPase, and DNA-binding Fis domains [Dethiosulfatibacter aminovorans DSM 17477]|uniref:Transcriptional regulator containing PAS, AAA-type ATPase, and DNA-binding Fis domains n=1 Tax=Dethiosulfatibacter aminovorans DSM 17477 TaxID=1121476 RepID=A0A1M6EN05_9FIRM|nr:sigma 54-interacting transcriptional regulator [Dethiosulfatibacter aminovorans]SHI86816.1 Transcriptional regulator containing PAS, AAA-type ATPase, and DNA-binding Fis domains [Dethiosulfatibacter aminovorans DSM 17477]
MSNTQKNDLYRKALEHYSGTVVIIDKNADVLYANDFAAETLGIAKEKLLQSNYYHLIEQGVMTESAGLHALETGEQVNLYCQNYKQEGMYIYSVPELNPDGTVEYVYSFGQNNDKMDAFLEWVNDERKTMLTIIKEYISSDLSIIAESEEMKNLLSIAKRIAPTNGTILIYGESGCGKEVLANYIHKCSNQSDDAFLAINCAAIPEEIAESEFFGYEPGSFTGANNKGKIGYFEAADGGTLFLDEIGELSLKIQAKILRVLENKQITRVGGSKTINVNPRILCATNRDLKQMVKEGKFREDLYYRLNVLPLFIPPLRHRKADIEPLASKFLKEYNKKYGTDKMFSTSLRKKMKEYSWPGNIRELRNLIERTVLISQNSLLSTDIMFQEYFIDNQEREILPLKSAIKDMERAYLEKVFNMINWDIKKAAQLLEVHQSGLYQKLKDYNLTKTEDIDK